MEDYYQVLEVTQDVTQDLIHKAYKRLALLHHPDKNPRNAEDATETFQLVILPHLLQLVLILIANKHSQSWEGHMPR